MPRKKSSETKPQNADETIKAQEAQKSAEPAGEGGESAEPTKAQESQESKGAFDESLQAAWEWTKAAAKRALPKIGKAADVTSNWAWDNAAAVIAIAVAAMIDGVLGLLIALAVLAVLNYYKSSKE
ncbi:MAG: hypothetical protein LBO72_07595 [Helicobacteraceae bacterium]|jgi:hypothetical protein|nr:hypothetical protein [Helicobacteraceae bacterium]